MPADPRDLVNFQDPKGRNLLLLAILDVLKSIHARLYERDSEFQLFERHVAETLTAIEAISRQNYEILSRKPGRPKGAKNK